MMKVAIIGSGISGLTSAYLLAGKAHVTLYESHNELGGHANTHTAILNSKHIPVDTGFMVYNPGRYPNFVELLKRLDVETLETKMSLSVVIPDVVTFKSNFPGGVFADRTKIFSPSYIKFLLDILKFRKTVKKEFNSISKTETLGEFLTRTKTSKKVIDWFLFPMLSSIWSCADQKKISEFPAHSTFVFMNNHKLLDQYQPTWRTIRGGSVEYVSKIESFLSEKGVTIHKNTAVRGVRRTSSNAQVETKNGTKEYDLVIFATHANITKNIILDKSAEEEEALSCFTYSKNTTVLHSETRLMPKNKNAWAAWNYAIHTDNLSKDKATFTYNMNELQSIDANYPLFVTLNSPIEIEKKLVHGVFNYEHPFYNVDALKGQGLISKLQGKNRVLFTGAHLGFGFHEDGVVSAIEALKVLNILPPWHK